MLAVVAAKVPLQPQSVAHSIFLYVVCMVEYIDNKWNGF